MALSLQKERTVGEVSHFCLGLELFCPMSLLLAPQMGDVLCYIQSLTGPHLSRRPSPQLAHRVVVVLRIMARIDCVQWRPCKVKWHCNSMYELGMWMSSAH
jgi:hypothetical protein